MAAVPSPGDLPPASEEPKAGGNLDPQLSPNPRKRLSAEGSGSGTPSADCRSFSQLLAGAMACTPSLLTAPMLAVPFFLAPAAMLEAAAMTGPFLMSHQAVLATVTAQAQMRLQVGCQSSTSNSFPSPVTPQKQPVATSEEKVTAMDTAGPKKNKMTDVAVKTVTSDGYNWRKYGQKPAKQSEIVRSYYRCSDANCSAKKKVARCPDGRVTETVYHGVHNHECPQKSKLSKEEELPCHGPMAERENIHTQKAEGNDSLLNSSEVLQNSCHEAAGSFHCTGYHEDDTKINKDVKEPGPKRRTLEGPITHSHTVCKTVKEQKVIIENLSNPMLDNDVYKWRKYGQKNIKGNLNPRSYYKCTQTGCPARKHVEKASDDAKTIHVTYEGRHNHEPELHKSESELPLAVHFHETPVKEANKRPNTSTPDTPSVDSRRDAEEAIASTASPELVTKMLESERTCAPCNSASCEEATVPSEMPKLEANMPDCE